MEGKKLGDAEYLLLMDEEKRLCENNIQLLKGKMVKDFSIENGEIVKEDKVIPSIILGRKLTQKYLYKSTINRSRWKLISDRNTGELCAFLEIEFPKTNAPSLNFCFEMNTKLKKNIKIIDIELIETFMEFDGDTGVILKWMKLLIDTGGRISISDREEPSINLGIQIDVPRTVLKYFDDIIATR